jgi:FtsP/CotA-like multicopper oxidase with cupredoxin domain
VNEKNDGHPSYAVASEKSYEYDFGVDNRAGSYWYHPHPMGRTATQVYQGLAGGFIVSDDEEQRLGLPDADRDLLLVLQDRSFDEKNQLVYAPNPMLGFLGDQVLVNGAPAQTWNVAPGPHRLRILNGSNSRIYDLAWSDGTPITLLGTDGGLLAKPTQRAHVVLAPAQRIEIWADFGGGLPNDVWLTSRAFSDTTAMMGGGMMGGGMMGRGMMGGGMMGGGGGLPQGAPLQLQHFVAPKRATAVRVPERLVATPGPAATEVTGRKSFAVGMAMMRWLLNGRTFEMRGVASNERVRLNTVEEWEFVNNSHMMAMPHPIHLHGKQFQIVARNPGSGSDELRSGLFDEGWQDTFLLLPGDRVRVRVQFERYPGLFLYHCHNLEHEDLGMMRNFLVEGA